MNFWDFDAKDHVKINGISLHRGAYSIALGAQKPQWGDTIQSIKRIVYKTLSLWEKVKFEYRKVFTVWYTNCIQRIDRTSMSKPN